MANYSSSSVGEPVPEIKSSRCITITESTATLSLEVTNYPRLERMGVSEYIRSPIFRAGGYDWCILFYPNGYDASCAGNASVYLTYLGAISDVSAKYTLSLQGKEGQAPAVSFGPMRQVFSPGGFCTVGYRCFAERSKMNLLSSLGDGCFTIRCVLTLENESPPPELPGNLERMLGDGTGADLTIAISGRENRAHKSHLTTRSPEFHEQFIGPMMEKDMPCFELSAVDVEPTIFEMLLHYVNTHSLPRCEDEGGYNVAALQHLMVAADMYKMDRLKLVVEEQLCSKIDMDTAINMFALATKHNCKNLKEACLRFMASPEVLGTIMEADGFRDYFKANCTPLPLDFGGGKL